MNQPQAPEARTAARMPHHTGFGVDREHRSRRDVHAESERDQRARIRADAEECDMAQRKLPGVAEQQVQAHGGDDEDAGDDEDVQHVLVAHPQRQREQEKHPKRGEDVFHPMRSFRANRPVGLKIRISDDEQESHRITIARGDVARTEFLRQRQG